MFPFCPPLLCTCSILPQVVGTPGPSPHGASHSSLLVVWHPLQLWHICNSLKHPGGMMCWSLSLSPCLCVCFLSPVHTSFVLVRSSYATNSKVSIPVKPYMRTYSSIVSPTIYNFNDFSLIKSDKRKALLHALFCWVTAHHFLWTCSSTIAGVSCSVLLITFENKIF